MVETARISGMNTIIKNMRDAGLLTAKGTEEGLKKAGLFIQRESQLIVPVDFGPLKNSAFTRDEGKGFKTRVSVGYTAFYAIYVHEDLEARHRPGKTAKYLEKPVKQKRIPILKMIAGSNVKKYLKSKFKKVPGKPGL